MNKILTTLSIIAVMTFGTATLANAGDTWNCFIGSSECASDLGNDTTYYELLGKTE